MTSSNLNDILIEDFNSKFDAIMEAVGAMNDNVKRIPNIEQKVDNLERDMATLKLATKATNQDVREIKTHVQKIDKQLDDLEERIATVESA